MVSEGCRVRPYAGDYYKIQTLFQFSNTQDIFQYFILNHMWKSICLLLLSLVTHCLRLHDFYALEEVSVVSNSESIKKMNSCKSQCLEMGNYFPFKFKYHRYVLREKIGSNKYFEGTCWYSKENQDNWYPWHDLQKIINSQIFVDMGKLNRWQAFEYSCEDTTLKLYPQTLKSLEFTRVHSDFLYFDDGKFVNLKPFEDINELYNDVFGGKGF